LEGTNRAPKDVRNEWKTTTMAKTASEKDSMRRLVGFSSVSAGREPVRRILAGAA